MLIQVYCSSPERNTEHTAMGGSLTQGVALPEDELQDDDIIFGLTPVHHEQTGKTSVVGVTQEESPHGKLSEAVLGNDSPLISGLSHDELTQPETSQMQRPKGVLLRPKTFPEYNSNAVHTNVAQTLKSVADDDVPHSFPNETQWDSEGQGESP